MSIHLLEMAVGRPHGSIRTGTASHGLGTRPYTRNLRGQLLDGRDGEHRTYCEAISAVVGRKKGALGGSQTHSTRT